MGHPDGEGPPGVYTLGVYILGVYSLEPRILDLAAHLPVLRNNIEDP